MCLKIICSNIRFANEFDQNNSWKNRLPILSGLINEFETDILATQEGRQSQLKELKRSLPSLTLIENHRSWISQRMYPSFFINTDKIRVLDSGDIWLSETPEVAGSSSFNSAFPRICTWAFCQVATKKFLISNTHLDHTSEETRIQQLDVMINQLANRFDLNNINLIVLGDFNTGPDSYLYQELIKNLKLEDCWKKFNQVEISSYHHFQGLNYQGKRIDWALQKGFNTLNCHFDLHNHDNIFPSDHFPLKLELV